MAACQLLTGGGGWPLTILMTPDRRPFYAGTYIPRESRSGMVGMLVLIPGLSEVWRKERNRILETAGEITTALQGMDQGGPGELPLDRVLHEAYDDLRRRFDRGSWRVRFRTENSHGSAFLFSSAVGAEAGICPGLATLAATAYHKS